MRIIIRYNSSWQGVLSDGSNSQEHFGLNREQAKEGRREKDPVSGKNKIIATVPFFGGITNSTIEGILYRLVGEQRPMWMVRQKTPYLSFIEGKYSFKVENEVISKEILALRDIGNTDNPGAFSGIMKAETNSLYKLPLLSSFLVFPLLCSWKDLSDLILKDKFQADGSLKLSNRLDLLDVLGNLSKENNLEFDNDPLRNEVFAKMQEKFPQVNYKPKDADNISVYRLTAMYLAAEYIVKNNPDLGDTEDWKKGIAHRLFTQKDFLKYMSGEGAYVINYPMSESFTKGKTKVTKSDGEIIIDLKLSSEETLKLKTMIEEAGVSTFNVGKKGLAYVHKMIL